MPAMNSSSYRSIALALFRTIVLVALAMLLILVLLPQALAAQAASL